MDIYRSNESRETTEAWLDEYQRTGTVEAWTQYWADNPHRVAPYMLHHHLGTMLLAHTMYREALMVYRDGLALLDFNNVFVPVFNVSIHDAILGLDEDELTPELWTDAWKAIEVAYERVDKRDAHAAEIARKYDFLRNMFM